jgi:hypothetical protein
MTANLGLNSICGSLKASPDEVVRRVDYWDRSECVGGDQYCTDSAAQIQAVLYQIDGPDHMLTSIECRSQAEEKITQAEREPRHRTRLLNAAQAWLILAGQMRRLEIAISGTGEVRSKIRAD